MRQRLVWFDAGNHRINRMAADGTDFESWETPHAPVLMALCDDGRTIVGMGDSLFLWDWDKTFLPFGNLGALSDADHLLDGAVGPDGTLWASALPRQRTGEVSAHGAREDDKMRLLRVAPDGSTHAVSSDARDACFGFLWPDEETLIATDAVRARLVRHALIGTVRLGDSHTILEEFPRGVANGACLDRSGQILNCRDGGSCLVRSTASGFVNLVVNIPLKRPTGCCFGGPDMDILFVLSSSNDPASSGSDPASQGSVLAIEGLGRGNPPTRFSLPS